MVDRKSCANLLIFGKILLLSYELTLVRFKINISKRNHGGRVKLTTYGRLT